MAQTQAALISTLPQSFSFGGAELNYHNIREDLNSTCAFVYAPSPNFSGKVVVSAVLQSELSLLITGDDYRGRPEIRRCRHTDSERGSGMTR